VDCEKLPESKKTVKKYSSSSETRKKSGEFPDNQQRHTASNSGTQQQVVSPEECSCECHHDALSPTSGGPMRGTCSGSGSSGSSGGVKPKVNPRTSSITARSKQIVPQRSTDRPGVSGKVGSTSGKTGTAALAKSTTVAPGRPSTGAPVRPSAAATNKTNVKSSPQASLKGVVKAGLPASSKPGTSRPATVAKVGIKDVSSKASLTKKGSPPPPVPIRTTSVSKSKTASDREISTNTRVVRDGSGRIVERTVTKTSAVRRSDRRNDDKK